MMKQEDVKDLHHYLGNYLSAPMWTESVLKNKTKQTRQNKTISKYGNVIHSICKILAKHLTSLDLSFSNYKMETMPPSQM